MQHETSDPLDKVFYSQKDSARNIANFILDYVRIDPDELTVLFVSDVLPIRCRILLYLLAVHVLHQLKKRPTNQVRPREIELGIHASGNTIRPLLIDLLSKELIVWSKEGYSVLPARMPDIRQYIEKAKYRKR